MNSEAPETQAGRESNGEDGAVEQAWKDFESTFKANCKNPLEDPKGKEEFRRLFKLTVGDVVSAGQRPWDEPCKRFPLGRVKEIAILSERLACGNRVSAAVLSTAAASVIAYWLPRCVARFTEETAQDVSQQDQANRARLLVWCTAYMKDMKPIDPSDPEGC